MALYLCGLVSKTHSPSLIMRKRSDQLLRRPTLQYGRPLLLKTVKIVKEGNQKLHSQGQLGTHNG